MMLTCSIVSLCVKKKVEDNVGVKVRRRVKVEGTGPLGAHPAHAGSKRPQVGEKALQNYTFYA